MSTKKTKITKNELTKKMVFPVATEEVFMDALNDEPEVVICGLTYSAGYVLREVDPIAFRTGMLDYLDSLKKDRTIVEIEDTLYWKCDVEKYFDISDYE